MNSAVNFLLESGVSLALLSLIYLIFLRRETFFRVNRIFLLFSVVFSIVLPFLKFRIYDPQPYMLPEITVTPYRNLLEAVTVYGHGFSGAVEKTISSSQLIVLVYLVGLLFFFGRFIFRLIQIGALVRRGEINQTGQFKFVSINKEFSPFSFLNYIFVSSGINLIEGYEKMVAHEMEHIKQGHTVDVLILEIMAILQWFNPFMWMLKRVIRENHEFLADQAVLQSGITPARYKLLLLNQIVGFQPGVANNFNSSLIKNRIKMISKIRSAKIANIKILFGVVVILGLVIAFACEQKKTTEMKAPQSETTMKMTLNGEVIKIEGKSGDLDKIKSIFSEDTGFETESDSLGNLLLMKKQAPKAQTINGEDIFVVVENMPEFPGGEKALIGYLSKGIVYPDKAKKEGIQGTVYIKFVVAKDGSISNVEVTRGIEPSLDAEAVKVIKSMPNWKPGMQGGKPVNVAYTIPIRFALN
jgi:TonB family protein